MSEETRKVLPSAEILRMTSNVVAAYLHNNPLPSAELPNVIQTIHGSLKALNNGGETQSAPQKPAVSVRRSVTPDYIVCLEDGKKLKMLKRHLPELLTYFRHRITNAVTEGFNSRIQAIKAAARGFRNFANYRIRILFFCGRLDLIPENLTH